MMSVALGPWSVAIFFDAYFNPRSTHCNVDKGPNWRQESYKSKPDSFSFEGWKAAVSYIPDGPHGRKKEENKSAN